MNKSVSPSLFIIMTKVIYAGSFDPLTNGHLWVIKQACNLFDEVIVAIGLNSEKKYKYSLEQRVCTIIDTVHSLKNVTVDSFANLYLVDYAQKKEAKYIIRGIRNQIDYEKENSMKHINVKLNPYIETIFVIPPKELTEFSSSVVKSLIGFDNWKNVIKEYVPTSVYDMIIADHQNV